MSATNFHILVCIQIPHPSLRQFSPWPEQKHNQHIKVEKEIVTAVIVYEKSILIVGILQYSIHSTSLVKKKKK